MLKKLICLLNKYSLKKKHFMSGNHFPTKGNIFDALIIHQKNHQSL